MLFVVSGEWGDSESGRRGLRDRAVIAAAAGGASGRRRWIALGVLCLGQLMIVLDATIVNVALPSIQHDLHFTQQDLTRVMDGYLIPFGGFLLLAGRVGADR